MYNVSDLLGKPLIDLASAGLIGTIANIYFDDKCQKGIFLKLFTEDEETIFFPLAKVNINGDAAITVGGEPLETASGLKCPINSYAFNQDGKLLGKVTDVVMDGVKTQSVILNNTVIEANKLLSAGSVLIVNDSGKPVRFKQTKRTPAQKPIPQKRFAPSYDFLLGKKLQRTITASDGKIIARAGEKITGDTISLAKTEGKLVILALNSL